MTRNDLETQRAARSPEPLGDSGDGKSEQEIRSLRREVAFWQQRSRELAGHLRQANQALVQVLPTAKVYAPVQATLLDKAGGPAGGILGDVQKCHFYIDRNGDRRLFVHGWTWSMNSQITAIDLFVSSRRVGGTAHGTLREDVRRYHNGPPEMAWSGFSRSIPLPPDFSLDAECYLQVCDAEGRRLRFALRPVMEASSGIRLPQQTRFASAIARVSAIPQSLTDNWMRKWLKWTVRRKARNRFRGSPVFVSFLLLVNDQEYSSLKRCIDSVERQFCGCWELFVLPQGELGKATAERLLQRYGRDRRVRVLPPGSLSRAGSWNDVLGQAAGQYACFLTGREILADDALTWMALAVETEPQAAWLYCDGQIVDQDGRYVRSDYKPDFSDVHLWATFFTRGFSIYKKSEVLRVGGLREEAAGVEEYDLTLRLTRELLRQRIVHIPKPLFRALDPEATDSPDDLRRRWKSEAEVVNRAIHDAGVEGTVRSHASVSVIRRIELTPRSNARVVIVIPTRDKAALLRRCLDSLRRATKYPNYRVTVVDNQSTEPALFDLLEENAGRDDFEVVHFDQPFNHSLMHNDVLADVDAEFALLLNNDVVDFSEGWLEQLVATAQIARQVACVGALLLYPDGRVQHGGVILDREVVARHAHVDVPGNAAGYANRLHCLQDLSACTGACLLIRLTAFREVGGFDAENFPNSFNDVDLCLRLRDAGYRCLFQPAVQATHYESASRGVKPEHIPGLEQLRQRLRTDVPCDPYHNPRLTADLPPLEDGLPPADNQRWRLQHLSAQLDGSPISRPVTSSESASLCIARKNGVF